MTELNKRISDRRDKVWKDRCQSEINIKTGRICNKLTDEDTGLCPLKHGRSLHSCYTRCCIIWVAGNHKFCAGHRKDKVKTIKKTVDKISRRWRSLMWGKLSETINLDNPDSKKEFNDWSNQQIEKTYDQEYLKNTVHSNCTEGMK